MGVGAVMCWARLTCFYPHAKSGVFQSSLSILSLYSATCLTSFCPNISGLNVWVLFSYSWSWKFIETSRCCEMPAAQAFLLGSFLFSVN